MNIQEFRKQFPDEASCHIYLEQMIWPSGRICPHCGGVKSWSISAGSRRFGLYECATCNKQFTVTTKTPLHSTKLPLRIWLMAMYFMVNSSKGIFICFPCEVDRDIPEDSLESWPRRPGTHGLTGKRYA